MLQNCQFYRNLLNLLFLHHGYFENRSAKRFLIFINYYWHSSCLFMITYSCERTMQLKKGDRSHDEI